MVSALGFIYSTLARKKKNIVKQEFKKYIDSYIELFPNFNSEEVAFLKSYLTIEEYSKKGFFV